MASEVYRPDRIYSVVLKVGKNPSLFHHIRKDLEPTQPTKNAKLSLHLTAINRTAGKVDLKVHAF
jgi:hypothetical protein